MSCGAKNLNAMLRAVAAQKPRNRLFGALLLGLRRLEMIRRAPAMDPAVLDETLGYCEGRDWMELESRHREVEIIDKTCAHFRDHECLETVWAVSTQPAQRFLLRIRGQTTSMCVGLMERRDKACYSSESGITFIAKLPVCDRETFWLIECDESLYFAREVASECDFAQNTTMRCLWIMRRSSLVGVPMHIYVRQALENGSTLLAKLDVSIAALDV